MTVVDQVNGATVKNIVKRDVVEGQIVKSDGFSAYPMVEVEGYRDRGREKGPYSFEVDSYIDFQC